MIRTPITSSNIESIGYDPESGTLEVAFKSGSIYHYHEVSPEHFANLMGAESKGSHLHEHIKGTHRHSKLDDGEG